jgi:hypothetical protein
MAESSFDKLDHRMPLAQPEVRHVGPGWDNPGQRVDRQDPVNHGALYVPGHGELPPAPEPPPKPKPPALTETERREKLKAAIATFYRC